MDRRTFLMATGAGATVALAGCLEGSGQIAGDEEVGMTIDSYEPETKEVEPGTTVTFRNTSSHAHTVTAYQDRYPEKAEYWASGGFDSEDDAIEGWYSREQRGRLVGGETYEHTFEYPGRYWYYCIPHVEAAMVGEIIVTEE